MTEILAPAGDEQSAYAAINSGANAIYLGLSEFSARSSAENFELSALETLISHAHVFNVKIYVAMNTLVKQTELEEFIKSAAQVWNLGADALIIQDLYLGAYLKKNYPQMCLHLSTQAGVNNVYGAKYAKELGYSRVVLARETPLAEIAEITKIIETEVFVQGALCTCFSGQCYLSSFAGGNSGNRGKCKQPCRKKYKLDREGYEEYAYRVSLSDLCVGESTAELIKAGVKSLKIEGRMRRPEYVAAAVKYYKGVLAGNPSKDDLSALKRTYNRGNYTKGLAFGQDKSLISSAVQGHIGEFVGSVSVENSQYIVHSFFKCAEGDCFKILRNGAELCGAVFAESVKGGFKIKCATRLKNGDKAFITTDAKLNEHLLKTKRKIAVKLSARFAIGEIPEVEINGKKYLANFVAERALGRPMNEDTVKSCFDKVDTYPFSVSYGNIEIGDDVFVPASFMNVFRRFVYSHFLAELNKSANKKIDKIYALPKAVKPVKNAKTCVMARSLTGVSADIGVLKPDDYKGSLSKYLKGFTGEKFLFLPPFMTSAEIEAVKPHIKAFDGIYCDGNYAVPLAKELNKKLFAGVGFNLFNSIDVSLCPADYIALSKELSVAEAKPLARANTFYLTAGDLKVMDLIYCPFGKTCKDCDRRETYTLTDEEGRAFTVRKYLTSGCRFELYNCAPLVAQNDFTGALADLTVSGTAGGACAKLRQPAELKKLFKRFTKGHSENPVS